MIVIAVAVVVLAFTSRMYINNIFDRYTESYRGVVKEHWEIYFKSYYLSQGSWDGVEDLLTTHPGRRGGSAVSGMERGGYRGVLPGEGLLLADAQGLVVLDTQYERVGETLPGIFLERGNAILINGEKVGTLMLLPSTSRVVLTLEEQFSRSVFFAILWGALGALAVGALISYPLTRQIVRPLALLASSARKFASREFGHRVPLEKRDEIGNLAEAFNFMADSIEKNEKLRHSLLTDISHELRTPLTVLRGNFEALQAGRAEATPELLSSLYDEVLRLGRLVNDLETINLAEAGKLTLNRETVDLKILFSRVANVFQNEAVERRINLHIDEDHVQKNWILDEDRITQVLINLLANAFKFTPDHGKIEMIAEEENDWLIIKIKDSGPGIPEQEIPFIFERFYKTGTGRGDGCGLGLSITKSFIEAHGGKITVFNRPRGGSEFSISLPYFDGKKIQG